MTRQSWIRVVSFVLTFTIIFSITGYAQTSDDIKADIESLDKKIEAYQNKLNSLENQKSESAKNVSELQTEVDAYEGQINALNEKISALNKQISAKQAEIDTLQKQIDILHSDIETLTTEIEELNIKIEETYKLLGERMRASYMAGSSVTTISLFLEADSFESYLTTLELLDVVAKHDNELITTAEAQIKESNSKKESLAAKQAEVENNKSVLDNQMQELQNAKDELLASKKSVTSKTNAIDNKISSINKKMNSLDKQSSEYQTQLKAAQKRKEKFSEELDTLIKQEGSSGSGSINNNNNNNNSGYKVSSKGMICPLQYSNVYISSPYGQRSSGWHGGIDLCTKGAGSTMGKDIRAAAGGKVIISGYHSSYGNYIVIDHGNGVTTYYAHASKLIASKGDNVAQGEVIASVGSTGNSTGPHLHFEVRINGTRTNPTSYIIIP